MVFLSLKFLSLKFAVIFRVRFKILIALLAIFKAFSAKF